MIKLSSILQEIQIRQITPKVVRDLWYKTHDKNDDKLMHIDQTSFWERLAYRT